MDTAEGVTTIVAVVAEAIVTATMIAATDVAMTIHALIATAIVVMIATEIVIVAAEEGMAAPVDMTVRHVDRPQIQLPVATLVTRHHLAIMMTVVVTTKLAAKVGSLA